MNAYDLRRGLAAAVAVAAMVLVCGESAQAVLIGNDLTPRGSSPGDTATTVLFTNFVPIPVDGAVDSVSFYCQGRPGSFRMLQLRPTGTGNEHTIVYDSGSITSPESVDAIENIAFPNGPAMGQAGDLFAHYGNGIPFSTTGGLNAENPHAIYYSVSATNVNNAIANGTPIDLDGSTPGFPKRNDLVRDYAWAVNVPQLVETDATPSYVDGTYYRIVFCGSFPPTLNNTQIWNYDTGTCASCGQQYPWFDLSSAPLDEIPCADQLLSAKLVLTGSVIGNTDPTSAKLAVFSVPDDNKGIDSILTGNTPGIDYVADYYAAHSDDIVAEVDVSISSGVFTAEWDITPLMAEWLANPSGPQAGEIVLLNNVPLRIRWYPDGGAPGPALKVVTFVPEPGTLGLLGLGGLGLLARRRRRAR